MKKVDENKQVAQMLKKAFPPAPAQAHTLPPPPTMIGPHDIVLKSDAELRSNLMLFDDPSLRVVLPEVLIGLLEAEDKTGFDRVIDFLTIPEDTPEEYQSDLELFGQKIADRGREDLQYLHRAGTEQFEKFTTRQAEAIAEWLLVAKSWLADWEEDEADKAIAYWSARASQ